MRERMQGLARRLVSYWQPWRALLIGSTVLAWVLAAVIDAPLGAAFFAAISVVPLFVLLGLTGTRQADHHTRVHKLETEAVAASARLDASQQQLAVMADQIDRAEERVSQASLFPARAALCVVVIGRDGDGFAAFLQGLAHRLPDAVQGVVVDATETTALGFLGTGLQDLWRSLRLVAAPPGASVEQQVAAGVSAALSRYILVLDDALLGPDDVDPVVELCGNVPGAAEPWVAARRHPGRPGLALVRASAIAEVQRSIEASGLRAEDEVDLVAAGFVVDAAGGWDGGLDGSSVIPAVRRPISVAQPRHELHGAIGLMPQAAYHSEELFPIAEALAAGGHPAAVLAARRWWARMRGVMHRSPVPVFDQPDAGAWLAQLAGLVTMNDWAQQERDMVEAARGYGVTTFAKVEGVQDFDDVDVGRSRSAYQRVDHVLCQGQNDLDAVNGFGGHGVVVGSSRLERAWSRPPRQITRPLVVINLNFTWGVLEAAREEFLRTAIEGVERTGLDVVVSAHPYEKPPADVPVSTLPMSDLLEQASVLVSRFSTVPFEAMARGVPFVYHNPHGEQVPTFQNPDGAFETTRTAAELEAAIRDGLTWESNYRFRAEPFFRQQVDIDPELASAQRGCAAILGILGRTDLV